MESSVEVSPAARHASPTVMEHHCTAATDQAPSHLTAVNKENQPSALVHVLYMYVCEKGPQTVTVKSNRGPTYSVRDQFMMVP